MQVLTAIGNFCIVSIAIGIIIEIIVMYAIQKRNYRDGINNLLVLLIGGIPIAMPTVLSVTMAIGSHRLSQQVLVFFSHILIFAIQPGQYCMCGPGHINLANSSDGRFLMDMKLLFGSGCYYKTYDCY